VNNILRIKSEKVLPSSGSITSLRTHGSMKIKILSIANSLLIILAFSNSNETCGNERYPFYYYLIIHSTKLVQSLAQPIWVEYFKLQCQGLSVYKHSYRGVVEPNLQCSRAFCRYLRYSKCPGITEVKSTFSTPKHATGSNPAIFRVVLAIR
jgi:hypothetical protein